LLKENLGETMADFGLQWHFIPANSPLEEFARQELNQ